MRTLLDLLIERKVPIWVVIALLIVGPVVGTTAAPFVSGFFSKLGEKRAEEAIATATPEPTPTPGLLNEEVRDFLTQALKALDEAYGSGDTSGLDEFFCDEGLEIAKHRVEKVRARGWERQWESSGDVKIDVTNPLEPLAFAEGEKWKIDGIDQSFTSAYRFKRIDDHLCIVWMVEEAPARE